MLNEYKKLLTQLTKDELIFSKLNTPPVTKFLLTGNFSTLYHLMKEMKEMYKNEESDIVVESISLDSNVAYLLSPLCTMVIDFSSIEPYAYLENLQSTFYMFNLYEDDIFTKPIKKKITVKDLLVEQYGQEKEVEFIDGKWRLVD